MGLKIPPYPDATSPSAPLRSVLGRAPSRPMHNLHQAHVTMLPLRSQGPSLTRLTGPELEAQMAERRLKLVVGGASDAIGDGGSPRASQKQLAFVDEAHGALNYFVYWCACWIARAGRARFETARS
jgi:hypothetical protein